MSRRVAALYDIHGNLPALEAVLDGVRRADVDHIVVGGDVLPGPMPRECLHALRSLDVPLTCIRGNGEREVLALRAGEEPGTVPATFHAMMRWVASALDEAQVAWLSGWPATATIEVDGLGAVLCCHATPRSDTELFTRLTPEEQIAPAFADVGLPVVLCGHTHMPFVRTIGGAQVANPGSVGMPFGEPGAYWALLGPTIELRRTAYDGHEAAERVRRTAYPQAEDFAAGSILRPPAEAEMLERFTTGTSPT